MDEHDEAFEAIPWDRFGAEPRFDPRLALAAAILILAVGVGAFALRRSVPPPTVAAPVAAAPTTSTVLAPTTTTIPEDFADLWAPEPVAVAPDGVAARFLLQLLEGSGVRVASVLETSAAPASDGSVVVVEAQGSSESGEPIRLGLEVVVAPDGAVVSWEPRHLAPLEVRALSEGAVPPPEVLDQLSRTVARWGTALEVVRSGIDGDRWWVEFRVGLPGGAEVPLVVWEGQ